MHRVLAAVVLALIAAAPARAADPATGEVSTAAPEIKWSGTSTAGFVTTFSEILVNAAGEKEPCQAPSCDTFTLEVKNQADLEVAVESAVTITYLQIEKPDGSIVYADGIEPEGTEADPVTKLKIKKAAVGTYKVGVATNSFMDETYTGNAKLLSPPVVVAPAPASTTPAVAAPAPATLAAKAGKLSAKKLARTKKLPLTLTTSAPVTDVKVILGSKGKAVATGTLARLDKTGRLTLKLRRKLKPGRYDLVLEAIGAAGLKTTLTVRR